MEPAPPFLHGKLNRGEAVRWIGKPNARRYALNIDPWSYLLLTAWTTAAFSGIHAEGFARVIAIAFVAGGLGGLLHPVYAYLYARRLTYVVTNERALIFGGIFSQTLTSVYAEDMNDLHVESGKFLGETIYLSRSPFYVSGEYGGWAVRTVSLAALADSKAPYAALQALKHRDHNEAPYRVLAAVPPANKKGGPLGPPFFR